MMRILGILLIFFSTAVWSTGLIGLNYQTYASTGPQPAYMQAADGTINNRTLLSSGVVSTVNYQWGGGAVLNSGRAEGVIVRFYGFINIPTAGTYWFGGQADDGIRIRVNDIQVVDSWIESGGAFRSGSVSLPAGVVPIELIYYENGGGAMVNLQWYQNNSWSIVDSEYLATDSTYWAPSNPTTVGVSGGITITQAAAQDAATSRRDGYSGNSLYIDQIGNNNYITVQQDSTNNSVRGVGQTEAKMWGNFNIVDIRQGRAGSLGINSVELAYDGDNNNIKLYQDRMVDGSEDINGSGGHIVKLNLTGDNNVVQSVQRNNSVAQGHYTDIAVNGNANNILSKQIGDYKKTIFIDVQGNTNTVNSLQSESGQHYADVKLTGNGHNVLLEQSGTAGHRATVNLTNSGGSSTLDLQQTGSTSKSYSITQSCVTASGCSVTVRQ